MNTNRLLISTFCSLLSAFALPAADFPLAWDPAPGASSYVLYAGTNQLTAANLTNAPVKLNLGTNLTARVEGLQSNRWYFAVTAIAGGLQSDPSANLIVDVPTSPANMRTVIVQYAPTLTNAFQDVGFFRLRIP